MNWTAKYVVFESGDCIVFSETIKHDVMKRCGRGEIVGAGKCWFTANSNGYVTVSCAGKSDSLNIQSRESVDEQIIGRYMLQYDLR